MQVSVSLIDYHKSSNQGVYLSLKIIGTVSLCKDCPKYRYYSADIYECTLTKVRISKEAGRTSIPASCPLQDYPYQNIDSLEKRILTVEQRLGKLEDNTQTH